MLLVAYTKTSHALSPENDSFEHPFSTPVLFGHSIKIFLVHVLIPSYYTLTLKT